MRTFTGELTLRSLELPPLILSPLTVLFFSHFLVPSLPVIARPCDFHSWQLLYRYMSSLGNKRIELFDMGAGVSDPAAENNVRMASGWMIRSIPQKLLFLSIRNCFLG